MLLKTIKIALTTVLIGFVSYYIYTHIEIKQLQNISFNYSYLLFSFVILAIQIFNQSLIWSNIIKGFNRNIKTADNSKMWLLAQYGKYIPGKIATFGIIFYLYKKYDISKNKLVVASYYEILCSILSVIYLSFVLLIIFNQDVLNQSQNIILFIFGSLTTISLHPKVINAIIVNGLRVINKPNLFFRIELSFSRIIKFIIMYMANNILLGFGFYLFINSIIYIPISKLPYLILCINLSGLLGMLAIFSPAGLGARESSIIFLLTKIMSVTIASVISIISRLWFVLGEIIVLGLVYIYNLIFYKINVVDSIKNLESNDQ